MASSTPRPDIFAIRGWNGAIEAQLTVRDWSKTGRSPSVDMRSRCSFFEAEVLGAKPIDDGTHSL
jgi:hypothetical protein